MKKKRKGNWRSRNQITQEVQADLRKKRIFINSKRPLTVKTHNACLAVGGRLNNFFDLKKIKEALK